jgi:hypothetical protein
MSSALDQPRLTPEEALGIHDDPELAPNDDTAAPYSHWQLDRQSEDYFASRVIYDTAADDQAPIDSLDKAEALIMSEIADYLQASHCDDFWRPRNQQAQKVGIMTTNRWDTVDSNRLFLLPVSSLHSSGTSKKLPKHHQMAPRSSISSYTQSLCSS